MVDEKQEFWVSKPDEILKALLRYYELHVTHRTQVFNVMMVMAGAATLAFTTALKDGSDFVASAIAFLAGLLVLALLAVHVVTLKKIDRVQYEIEVTCKPLAKVYNPDVDCRGLGDRQWKGAIFLLVAVAFEVGAVLAPFGVL